MKHLTSDAILEAAEQGPDRDAAHVEVCAQCRAAVEDLRDTLAGVRAVAVDVPEPSPLFWQHFDRRVRDAVAAAGEPGWSRWAWPWHWPRLVLPTALAAAVVLAGVLVVRTSWQKADGDRPVAAASAPRPFVETQIEVQEILASPRPIGDDVALALVAAWLDQTDPDGATDGEFVLEPGAIEEAAGHLSPDEQRELARLLQAELRPAGGQ